MTTPYDAIDILWARMNSDLKGSISGGVYKLSRPLNSDKEDIVINSITLNAAQLQEGVLNVNIHVPNLSINVNGVQDNTQPNFSRLKALTALAVSSLSDVWASLGEYNYTPQEPGNPLKEDGIDSYYSNIRVEFFSVNI